MSSTKQLGREFVKLGGTSRKLDRVYICTVTKKTEKQRVFSWQECAQGKVKKTKFVKSNKTLFAYFYNYEHIKKGSGMKMVLHSVCILVFTVSQLMVAFKWEDIYWEQKLTY